MVLETTARQKALLARMREALQSLLTLDEALHAEARILDGAACPSATARGVARGLRNAAGRIREIARAALEEGKEDA